MHIALYHGFPNMHYEMIGYAIDYCKGKYEFTVIAHNSTPFQVGWINYYKSIFGDFTIIPPHKFNSEIFNRIVLLTDDDPYFPITRCFSKTISIDHLYLVRNHKQIPYRICTRPRQNQATPWALQCYDTNTRFSQKKHSIVMIGTHNQLPESELRRLFLNFDELTFHVVAYNIKQSYSSSNVHTYNNIDAQKMHAIVDECSYMLCSLGFPCTMHAYEYEFISGSFSIGYTHVCRLIMPKSVKSNMTFETPLLIEEFPKVLNPITEKEYNDVLAERNHYIQKRNQVFDSVLVEH